MLLPSQFTPREIYDWYTAGLDLLPDAGNPTNLPAPDIDETFTAYRARVGDETILHSGDVLFAFLLFKLTGAGGNTRRAVHRLDRAIRDLTQVRIKLLKKQPNSPLCPTVTLLEGNSYTFTATDFGLIDVTSNVFALLSIKIVTLPRSGALTLDGVDVTAAQVIAATDIDKLVFTPAENAFGDGYAGLTFQVQDNTGAPISGVDFDPAADTITIDITGVNDAPIGLNTTVTVLEDRSYTFSTSDFFSDPVDAPAENALLELTIITLPLAGTLKLNNVNVSAGQVITAGDIRKLLFTPAANAAGTSYASFTFQVRDSGGTANGGADFDQSPNTITIDVVSVNDPPFGTDKTVTILETESYTFSAADFGFYDPVDLDVGGYPTPQNTLLSVRIETLPTSGTLRLAGSPVLAGRSIPAVDPEAPTIGDLVYTPSAPTENSAPYQDLFSFRVRDEGGTNYIVVDNVLVPNNRSLALTSNFFRINVLPASPP